jgi:hypothetical protein
MGTYYHTIGKLKRGAFPRRFIVLAAAPIVTQHGACRPLFLETLRLGALTYLHRDGGCSWTIKDYSYHDGSEMLDRIHKSSYVKETTWLMAYNLGYTLALSELWQHAIGGGVQVDGYMLQGNVQTVRMKIRGKRVNCVDARNYVQESMGNLYSMAKLPAPPVYADDDTDSLALDKARMQVAAMVELIMCLCQMLYHDADGAWGWSAGGIGWQSWRRGLMNGRVRVHAHPEATAMEREAYSGGRSECRFIGSVNGTVNEVDFNSLYAHCMSTTAMPIRLDTVEDCTVQSLACGLSSGRLAVARVELDARTNDYPYIMYPERSGPDSSSPPLPSYIRPVPQWRRIWGRGRFTATLAGAELLRAVASNEVAGVRRVSWYESGRPFVSFVAHWYACRTRYRESRRLIEEAICKRILTVLPGKFGQRAYEWIAQPGRKPHLPYGHWHEWDGEDGRFQLYRALAGAVQRYSPHRGLDLNSEQFLRQPSRNDLIIAAEHKHSFPAISAHVTSAARVCVDNAVAIAGTLDCYRYDTDSLDVSTIGLERLADAGLISQTEIGKLKLVRSAYGAAYRGPHDSTIGTGCDTKVNGGPTQEMDGCGRGHIGSGRTTVKPAEDNPRNPELPAVCGSGNVHQLFRSGSELWRSCVSVTAAARNRYAGRIGPDGWVRPLLIPADLPGRRDGELLDERSNRADYQ